MGFGSFIFDVLFGSGRSQPLRESYRDATASPTHCSRCGRYIINVYVYDGRPYGRECWETIYAEAERRKHGAEERPACRESLHQTPAQTSNWTKSGDPCPKCGKTLGAGVTRCWSPGCNYVVPQPVPQPSSPDLPPIRHMSICDEIRAERNIRPAKPKDADTQRNEYYEQRKAEYERRKTTKISSAKTSPQKERVVVDLISNDPNA